MSKFNICSASFTNMFSDVEDTFTVSQSPDASGATLTPSSPPSKSPPAPSHPFSVSVSETPAPTTLTTPSKPPPRPTAPPPSKSEADEIESAAHNLLDALAGLHAALAEIDDICVDMQYMCNTAKEGTELDEVWVTSTPTKMKTKTTKETRNTKNTKKSATAPLLWPLLDPRSPHPTHASYAAFAHLHLAKPALSRRNIEKDDVFPKLTSIVCVQAALSDHCQLVQTLSVWQDARVTVAVRDLPWVVVDEKEEEEGEEKKKEEAPGNVAVVQDSLVLITSPIATIEPQSSPTTTKLVPSQVVAHPAHALVDVEYSARAHVDIEYSARARVDADQDVEVDSAWSQDVGVEEAKAAYKEDKEKLYTPV
ncbi:hypothetical protein DXG03_008550 [Asterophora parasitica]|uniref:Uncharacterized protein n=1 Tax=Asterophora parasitica TaxID=117018 RepID=A0A9P7K7Y4_9AGAR|nr:hypothetical protein DXG03_008550 [Asterophora parasitica]